MQQFTRSLTREIEVGGERLAVTLSKEGFSVRPVGGRKPPHAMSWQALLHACVANLGQEPGAGQIAETLEAVRKGGPKTAEKASNEEKTSPENPHSTTAPTATEDNITVLLAGLDKWLNAHRDRFQQALQPGATAAECDELAAAVGKPLPAELRSLLSWHNGQNADVPGTFEQNWMLMSTQEIAQAKKELDAQPHEGWRSDWLPFLDDESGNYRCLDLSSAGHPVLDCWRGRADHPVVASSLSAWLASFVSALEHGDYAEDSEARRPWSGDTVTPCHLPQGYRMPAEWEVHRATWIAWPHQRDDWPDKFEPIPWVYGEIVRHLHRFEEVRLLVNGVSGERRARTVLDKISLDWQRISFWRIATDRVWTRDYGPIFVTNGDGCAILNWRFNAWAKYPNWQRDDAVAGRIAGKLRLKSWQPQLQNRDVVLEGGSIDVNGQGLLLTTEECLLSDVQQRNPGFGKEEYERVFADYLGVRKVLWLGRGIAGDDTHGHIDDLARFVAPRTVVTVVEEDRGDVNYEPLQENLQRLRSMTDTEGRPLEVHTLPLPAPLCFAGQRLPASYANFYIANDCVLVPTFNDPNDRRALSILADLFPERTVIGIHAVDLVWGLGTLHCLTQQQPAEPRP